MAAPSFPAVAPNVIRDVNLPPLRLAKLAFSKPPALSSIKEAVWQALENSSRLRALPAGSSVAVAVGSRGIASLPEVVAAAVAWLKKQGLGPFIVPAMGSHGGATAEGQASLLAELGVSESRVGAPVKATMETVNLGPTEFGIPCRFDKEAASAGGVLVINRVKPHTSFDRPIESGLVKMLAVGLGKAEGARNVHRLGPKGLAEVLPALARVALSRGPVAYGLALLESPAKELVRVEGVEPEDFFAAEERLLLEAKGLLARLPFDQLDVLVVMWLGKNISGTCMDYAVTGRTDIRGIANPPKPFVHKLVALRLTPQSHGNAMGLGVADFTTKALVESLDLNALYTNAMTATFVEKGKIPLVLPDEKRAIQAAVATCWRLGSEPVRMAVIKSTMELELIWVSEALAEELALQGGADLIGPFKPLIFNQAGQIEELF